MQLVPNHEEIPQEIELTKHLLGPVIRNPCHPSPCGPNSQCREVNQQAVCSCIQGFVGSPPDCRPECTSNSECPPSQACVNQKCRDPCPGTCGLNALCSVVNHNPFCTCRERYTGNPFASCTPIGKTNSTYSVQFLCRNCNTIQSTVEPVHDVVPANPCHPSPCGPNSQCKPIGDTPSCSCLPDFTGSPPNCRPECVTSSECASHLACINQKCKDPCPGLCGANAECRVISHTPTCLCSVGYTGDPFTQCLVLRDPEPEYIDPCNPSPCGANAICREQHGAGSCQCIPEHFGNPYEGCRPECILNSDCPSHKACVNNKCRDPCPGTCGQNAECYVVNHLPSCNCIVGYTGDPYRVCSPPPPQRKDK